MTARKLSEFLKRPGVTAALLAAALLIGFFTGECYARSRMVSVTVIPASAAAEAAPASQNRMNLNLASAEELQQLPGIGEALAERIVAYREENGPFRYPDELMNISGIGESLYQSLRDLVITADITENAGDNG